MKTMVLAALCVLSGSALSGCVGGDEAKESGTDSGGEGEFEDLGFDLMHMDCGPDDGLEPVLEIGLDGEDCDASAPADALWVRVMISGMASGVSGGSTYAVGSADLGVWVYPTGGTADYAFPSSGSLTLETYTEETEASGTFFFTMEDGTTVSGSFDAGFCDIPFEPCG